MADLCYDVTGTKAGHVQNTGYRAVHGLLTCTDVEGFDFAIDFDKREHLDTHIAAAEALREDWHKKARLGPTPLRIIRAGLVESWRTLWAEFGDETQPDILDSMRQVRDALVALEDAYDVDIDEARDVEDFDTIERLYAHYGLDVPAPGTEAGKAVAA